MATEPIASRGSEAELRALLDELPGELAVHVFTHASWTTRRSDSYERLAFLGDSVLSLAITSHLYPSLEAERFGAGQLTKIRAQTVSGRSCRAVAERLGVPDRLAAAAPAGAAASVPALVATERVLASVIEAVIGACFLTFGYERTARRWWKRSRPSWTRRSSARSTSSRPLQERLARRGALVSYAVVSEQGPPHDRTFTSSPRSARKRSVAAAGAARRTPSRSPPKSALESMRG